MRRAYTHRIGFLFKNFPKLHASSFASYSATNPKSPNFSTDDDEIKQVNGGGGFGSAVYRNILRNQRPTTVRWPPELFNSVSFIGRIDRPIVEYKKTEGHNFGAYTFISVKNPSHPNRTFRLQVEMRNDVAKIGVQHLNQNDNIYVSGRLGCYQMTDQNGNLISCYKVIAKELCYIAERAFHKPEKLKLGANLDEDGIERYKKRLEMWELFFCKPYEWWDRRKSKENSESPDFKHKYNGENLWLRADDPPWIKSQLKLLDMEIAKQKQEMSADETGSERYDNRNHMWQVFFSCPHEWWDNRTNKKNSRYPDFKHKDTGESLWIKPNDPPWVKRQLQRLDSMIAEQRMEEKTNSDHQLSKWI